jgi:hypothetical protein
MRDRSTSFVDCDSGDDAGRLRAAARGRTQGCLLFLLVRMRASLTRDEARMDTVSWIGVVG